jgi:hypothetical protein
MSQDPKPHSEEGELFDESWMEPPDNDDFPEVDPELENLRPQINWFRPFLMILVMVFSVYVSTKFEEELTFFLSPSEPVDVGNLTENATNSDAPLDIPHNRLVRVSGVPAHEHTSISCAASPPSRFFKLIGAPVYIQYPLGDDVSAIACEAERKPGDVFEEAAYVDEVVGRAVSFEATQSGRYDGFKRFYEQTSGVLFCSSMTEARREARINMLRQLLREKHKAQNGQYPSEEELQKELSKETLCQHAFLIQGEVTPSDYWHYLAVVIILGLIALWNVVALVLWIRRFLRITRGDS